MTTTDEKQSRKEPTREPAGASSIRPWASRPGETDTPEGRAAALFRQAAPPPPLAPQTQQRLRAHILLATGASASRQSRQRVIARWRWGIVAALLFGSGAVIAARRVDRWWTAAHDRASAQPALFTAKAAPRVTGGAPRPQAAESKLAMETRLIRGAIIRLRRERDPAGALAQLDDYLARFPRGTLSAEARGARVDALLLLDRRQDALAALTGLPLGDSARDQELRTIRGELRSAVDCTQALADFDSVLRSPDGAGSAVDSAVMERAFHGTVVCHLRAGQVTKARQEADRYLRQFPLGRFAAEMEQARDDALERSGTSRRRGGSGNL